MIMDILICALLVFVTGAMYVAVYRFGFTDGRKFYDENRKNKPQDGDDEYTQGWDSIISYTPDGYDINNK